MARTKDTDRLRTCPTCATPIKDTTRIGLRDYRWLNDTLPGRESASDDDAVIEKRGQVLVLEFKPEGVPVPPGVQYKFKTYVKKGIQVQVVWELWSYGVDARGFPRKVEVGVVQRSGKVGPTQVMTLARFKKGIRAWRDEAAEGIL